MRAELLFRVSLAIKGLDAIAEFAGGLFLLMPSHVSRVALELAGRESARHPHAAIGRILESLGTSVLTVTLGGAIYLMVHGLAKVVLIAAALKGKSWGYVGLIAVLSVFAVFELYRFLTRQAYGLLALAIFDGFVVYLIAKEYRTHGSSRTRRSASRHE